MPSQWKWPSIRIALPDAEGDGLVFIAGGNLAAAVQGDVPRQAVQQGRLAEVKPAQNVVIIAVFTHGHAVFLPVRRAAESAAKSRHDKNAVRRRSYRYVIVAVAAGGETYR